MNFKHIRGYSLYVCFDGKYHGFTYEFTPFAVRFLLGWISFGYIKADVERLIDSAADMAKYIKDNKDKLK
jgi:hypothetical protein